MRLQEEAEAVVRETVLDAGIDDAWDHVRDLAWLGEDAEVVEEEAPRRMTLRWVPDAGTVVDVVLDEVEEGTLVTVVEVPLRTLRAVSTAALQGAARGPMALAA